MRKFMVFAALLILTGLSYGQLDTSLLEDNTWVNIQAGGTTLPINGSDWGYENDFGSHPFYGFFILGPGHVVHPQDCYYYPFDPIANKWYKTNPQVRPTRQCMSCFTINAQDTVICQFGGAEASHQLSQGGWDAAYMNILQSGARGSQMWVYSWNRNEWYHMKGPTTLPGNAWSAWPQYDPMHDIVLLPSGTGYSFHHNCAVTAGSGGPSFQGFYYSAAMDTRRSLLYVLDVTGLWQFNADNGSWAKMAGTAPAHPTGANDGNGLGLNMMAYDEVNDVLIYTGDDLAYGAPNVLTWIFDCNGLAWEKVTPATAPRDRGKVAYNKALNCLMQFGGEASATVCRGGGTTGLWIYRYKRGPGPFADEAAAPNALVNTTGGKPVVSWNRVSEPGVTGYNVYRADAIPFPRNFAKLNTSPLTDTSYSDASAASATAYSYRVRAIKDGTEGAFSRHLYTRPGRVLNTAASVEESAAVKISWDRNPEADVVGYNVYRARAASMYTAPLSASYTKLTSSPVNALEYTDNVDLSDRAARGYVVTAVNAFGCESGTSQECTTFPNPPEFAYTIPVAGKTRLGWQPPRRTKILGVNFYRILGEKQNTAGYITDTVTNGWNLPPSTEGDGYSLMGKTYVVRAVNMLGQEGFMTDQISPTNSDYGFGVVTPAQRFNYNSFKDGGTGIEKLATNKTDEKGLEILPNPFNPEGAIHFTAGTSGKAGLTMLDIRGKVVWQAERVLQPGEQSVRFNLKGAASGLYLVRVVFEGKVMTSRAIYLQ